MVSASENTHFTTTDTALAAYLYSEGFDIMSVDSSKFPSVFSFKNGNVDINDYVRLFQTGKAEGNILTFFRSYKNMLSKIKDSKR